MARCPFCNKVLNDSWLRKMGAALMGKSGGASKARSRETMQAAAHKRWAKQEYLDVKVAKRKRKPKIPT